LPFFDILYLFNRLAASCKARTLRKAKFVNQFAQLGFPPIGKAPAMPYPKSCYLKAGMMRWAIRFDRFRQMRPDLLVTSFDNFG
jgi:hypothetical protein